MKKSILGVAGIAIALLVLASLALADENEEPVKPELKISAKLELFYENSKDVKSADDNDQFKTNELYLYFDGKFTEEFSARLQLDGADIVSSDTKVVTEKIVEEANFTWHHIAGSPVTVVFGKDEMPWGQDYDKYLNDPLVHNFEIDKVWGINGTADIAGFGSVALSLYQHRHTSVSGKGNEMGDNFALKVKMDKVVDNLSAQVSIALERYEDTGQDDEFRFSIGGIYKIDDFGNVNLEYVSFSNLGGTDGYDPGLITFGVEYDIKEKTYVFGRYESIIDDVSGVSVENDFWAIGVGHVPVKGFTVMAEFSNFNSGDLSDAKDLNVADGSIENSFKLGVRAKF